MPSRDMILCTVSVCTEHNVFRSLKAASRRFSPIEGGGQGAGVGGGGLKKHTEWTREHGQYRCGGEGVPLDSHATTDDDTFMQLLYTKVYIYIPVGFSTSVLRTQCDPCCTYKDDLGAW